MSSRDSISQWIQKKIESVSSFAPSGSDQTKSPSRKNEERNKTVYVLQTGNTLNSHKDFIDHLKKQVRLQEVSTVAECDFILVFCPVVSRAGTDIEAAVKKLNDKSETKPAVLVVLHHTFDPECVVPDSSRAVHRENTITVDCLFHEDKRLLQCHRNDESLSTVLDYINPQDKKKQLEEKESVPTQRETELMERIKQLEEKEKKVQGEGCAHTVMGSMKDTQQDQSVQVNIPETVDPETVEGTTNKAEEIENAQDKRDQPPNYPHIQKEQSLMQEMEKRLEERQKEMCMEMKQFQELKNCEEMNKKILSEKDAELVEKNKKIKELEKHLETTQRELKQKQTQLTDKETQLADMSKELETSRNTIMERGKQIQEKNKLIKDHEANLHQVTTALEERHKELEASRQFLESKETKLKNTLQELETSKNKSMTLEQELQEMMNIKEQQETELIEKNKQLKEKDRRLTEFTQKLQMKDKTLEEKDTLLREVKEELGMTKWMFEENQTEMKEKVRRLESEVKELEQKLIGKDKQPHEKDKRLNETTQTLQKKEETLKKKDTQKKEEDEGGADMGIVTCHTQLETKSQNKDQQAGEIKRQTENANEEVENNENSIQETGTLNKDGITELQKIANEPHDGKGAPHETDIQPALNDTQEPPIQVKETEKTNEKECNNSSEKSEHQKDEDTQQKKRDSDGNQSLENNKNSSCEGKKLVIDNCTESKRVHKSNLSESQTQHEDKDRPQIDNTEHLLIAKEQDTQPSDVKDESDKQTMEGQDTKMKEKVCALTLKSNEVNSESQEQEQGETGPELLCDHSDGATDSPGNETA